MWRAKKEGWGLRKGKEFEKLGKLPEEQKRKVEEKRKVISCQNELLVLVIGRKAAEDTEKGIWIPIGEEFGI